MRTLTFITALFGVVLLASCRGMASDDPPMHLNLNMDYQERFNAQEANHFFADGRAMRPPVPGTVARGMLKDDTALYQGRTADGAFVQRMPVALTREFLLRGRERYDIYCAVCHGQAGDGQGIVTAGGYGYTPAPSYHDAAVTQRMATDGYVYDVITRGIRTMPAYAHQIPVADRWAIVAYIRALQRSQHAAEGDLPASVLAEIQQQGGTPAAPAPADTASEDTPPAPPVDTTANQQQ